MLQKIIRMHTSLRKAFKSDWNHNNLLSKPHVLQRQPVYLIYACSLVFLQHSRKPGKAVLLRRWEVM